MPKAVFIDFDGTFADHGVVPAAHMEAVRRARENGHRVLLCTGRPKSTVPRRLLDSVFDGLVGGAGGYVEIGDTVLADRRFPQGLATRVVDLLTAHDVTFILEAPEALYGLPGIRDLMQAMLELTLGSPGSHEGADDLLDPIRETDAPGAHPFGKVSVFGSPIPVGELAEMIGPQVATVPNSVTGLHGHGGEIYLHGVDKAVGMSMVASHLGIDPSDAIGIGDGWNDLEMLEQAGTAVVVEGAPPEILALADHIVPGPAQAGIARAFAELGLTD